MEWAVWFWRWIFRCNLAWAIFFGRVQQRWRLFFANKLVLWDDGSDFVMEAKESEAANRGNKTSLPC